MAIARHSPATLIGGVGAALVIGLIVIGQVFGAGIADFPSAPRLGPTHLRSTPTLSPPLTDSTSKNDRFVALITTRAARDGYPVGEREQMLAAARVVCAMVASGQSVAEASAVVMTGYDISSRQAAGVASAAFEAYCPENKR